jgi:cyclic beta-1,2-glucan synthetase
VLSVGGEQSAAASCETDRAKFVGRGRSGRYPAAMDNEGELSGRVGAVLDPVFAIRTRLLIPARESAVATFTTFIATDRDHAVKLAGAYHDASDAASAFEDAIAESREAITAFGVSPESAAQLDELGGHFLFGLHGNRSREWSSDLDAFGDLRALGITRAVPIFLASIESEEGLPALRQLVEIHRYWMHKGIASDLVLLTTGDIPGMQLVTDGVPPAVTEMSAEELVNYKGGIFFLRQDSVDDRSLALLRADARMEVTCEDFELGRFLEAADLDDDYDAGEEFADEPLAPFESEGGSDVADLQFFNGLGGFNDANEYEIRLSGENLPPAPWINVVANPSGGFIASETGAGPTWAVNSSGYRLTPWQNDPVRDRSGECIYIIDKESGDVWTPTAAPIREASPYIVKHGAGYSIFEHEHDGIATSLRMGVPESDPVKLQVLTLRNESAHIRKLSIVSYVEWVLGGERELTRFNVRTSFDEENEVMLASNPLHIDIPNTISFVALSEPLRGQTASRRDFIGRNGTLAAPRWLTRQNESRGGEHAADPCAALATMIELAPGESKSIAIVLGAAGNEAEAREMAERYRTPEKANAAIDCAVSAWRSRLSAITVRTPEPSLDLMLNQWAFYQSLSCRVWGRIALFQSSGAYGFRDQLQDVTAFTYAEPSLAREQILRAASRQFEEGDVQHWWHPHSGRGVRTRFADDLVWLPFVIDHYLRVTWDYSVLDERVPYLHMRTLEPDEDELFAVPEISTVDATVFEHCVHILEHACTAGEHGLPLMKSGDWKIRGSRRSERRNEDRRAVESTRGDISRSRREFRVGWRMVSTRLL